jgi:phosphoesterase RecJ-like protein
MRVAVLFSGTTGSVKVSCRTSASAPSVDAAALMASFGGGGHVRAAGALIPGTDHPATRERVLAATREALDRARQPA